MKISQKTHYTLTLDRTELNILFEGYRDTHRASDYPWFARQVIKQTHTVNDFITWINAAAEIPQYHDHATAMNVQITGVSPEDHSTISFKIVDKHE